MPEAQLHLMGSKIPCCHWKVPCYPILSLLFPVENYVKNGCGTAASPKREPEPKIAKFPVKFPVSSMETGAISTAPPTRRSVTNEANNLNRGQYWFSV